MVELSTFQSPKKPWNSCTLISREMKPIPNLPNCNPSFCLFWFLHQLFQQMRNGEMIDHGTNTLFRNSLSVHVRNFNHRHNFPFSQQETSSSDNRHMQGLCAPTDFSVWCCEWLSHPHVCVILQSHEFCVFELLFDAFMLAFCIESPIACLKHYNYTYAHKSFKL